ncbi:MAG: tetratricopeptide repeat protein, partial [Verrucomicrobia bacterium]|nr:tetratricopeptide repeat protein [Verrucomicrobiota bacterium]
MPAPFASSVPLFLLLAGLSTCSQPQVHEPLPSETDSRHQREAPFLSSGNDTLRQVHALMRADQLTEAQDLVDLVDDRSSPLVAAEKACSSSELSIRRGHYADASTGMARCKEYLQHLQGNVKLAGYYHYISGFHHQMTGKYHPSIEDYEKALGLVMLDNPSPNEAMLSILNNLGNVYYRMGENAKSLSIHLEVLAGRRELWGNQ